MDNLLFDINNWQENDSKIINITVFSLEKVTSIPKLRIIDQPRNAIGRKAFGEHPDQVDQEASIIMVVRVVSPFTFSILYFLFFYNLALFGLFFYYFWWFIVRSQLFFNFDLQLFFLSSQWGFLLFDDF